MVLYSADCLSMILYGHSLGFRCGLTNSMVPTIASIVVFLFVTFSLSRDTGYVRLMTFGMGEAVRTICFTYESLSGMAGSFPQ